MIGFVYTRNENADEGQIYDISEIRQLPVPYKDVEVFGAYWAHYPKYRAAIKDYTSLEEFFDWCEEQGVRVKD